MPSGKCPKCDTVLNQVRVEQIPTTAQEGAQRGFASLSFLCPACSAILGVALHPRILATQLSKQAT